jgi:hypothetical protein
MLGVMAGLVPAIYAVMPQTALERLALPVQRLTDA